MFRKSIIREAFGHTYEEGTGSNRFRSNRLKAVAEQFFAIPVLFSVVKVVFVQTSIIGVVGSRVVVGHILRD